MRRGKSRYVKDLKDWALPRLEELEMRVADEFAAKAKAVYLDRDLFTEDVYKLFLERLRILAGAAASEIIEYWIKGFGNAHAGERPELTIELPYLEQHENVDALTIAYCVDIDHRTRMELNRATLEQVLLRIVEAYRKPTDLDQRLKIFAAELRTLATRLDHGIEAETPQKLA